MSGGLLQEFLRDSVTLDGVGQTSPSLVTLPQCTSMAFVVVVDKGTEELCSTLLSRDEQTLLGLLENCERQYTTVWTVSCIEDLQEYSSA